MHVDLNNQKLVENTFFLFWSGYYKEASKSAITVIKKFNSYLLFGRTFFVFVSNVFFVLSYFFLKKYNPKSCVKYIFLLLLAIFSILMMCVSYINVFAKFSTIRVQEFNILAFLIISSLYIIYFLIKNLHKYKKLL